MPAVVNITGRFLGGDQIGRAIKGIERSLNALDRKAKSLDERLTQVSSNFRKVGGALTAGLTAPIIAATTVVSKLAIETVESENLFAVSLGNMQDEAREFSQELRRQLGLNEFEIRRQVAVIFNMTQSMGIARDAAFTMSTALVRLAQDMASLRNTGLEEAFTKIQAGISGETEPLKRLGISIQETTLQTTALKLGIDKTVQSMTEQEKILLRTIAILQQTKTDQADLARTLNSPANQFRVLFQNIKQTAITVGQLFIPAIQLALGFVREMAAAMTALIDSVAGFDPKMRGAVVAAIGFLAVIGPLTFGLGLLWPLIGNVAIAISAVLVKALVGLTFTIQAVFTPVGAITTLLLGLGLTAAIVARNWETIEPRLIAVWSRIERSIQERILSIIQTLQGPIANFFGFEDALANVEIGTKLRIQAINRELGKVGEDVSIGDTISGLGDSLRDAFDKELSSAQTFLKDKILDIKNTIDRSLETLGGFRRRPGTGFAFLEPGFVSNTDAAKSATEAYSKALAELVEALKALGSASGDAGLKTSQIATQLEKVDLQIASGNATLQDRLMLLDELIAQSNKDSKAFIQLSNERIRTEAQIADIQRERLNLEIELGQKTLDARIEFLEQELVKTKENSIEQLRIRSQIAQAYEDSANDQIDAIQNVTDASQEEMIKQLQTALATYRSMGEAGVLAAEAIEKVIRRMTVKTGDSFESMRQKAANAAEGITRSFGDAFANTIVEGADFKESIISIFKDIAKQLISGGIQQILTQTFFPSLAPAAKGPGGIFDLFSFLGAGQQAGGGGGLASILSPLGQQAGPGAKGPGAAFRETFQTFNKDFSATLDEGIAGTATATTGFSTGLQGVFGQSLGGLGTVFTSFIGQLGSVLGIGPTGIAIGGTLGLLTALPALFGGNPFKSIIGGFGDFFGSFGGLFQHGGDFVTQGPKFIGVGEVAERVTVTPLGGRPPGNGDTFILSGPTFFDDVSMAKFERLVGRAGARSARRTI